MASGPAGRPRAAVAPSPGRRALSLVQLVRSGQPNPERFKGLLTTRSVYAFQKIILQKKLLQRPGPGVAHAFTFWGFLVIQVALLESVGEFFSPTDFRSRSSDTSFLARDDLRLLLRSPSRTSLIAFAIIRLKNNPQDLAAEVALLQVPHGTRVPDPLPDLPRRHDAARRELDARPRSVTCRTQTARSSRARSATGSRGTSRTARSRRSSTAMLILHVAVVGGFLILVLNSQAPAHLHVADQRPVRAPPHRARPPQAAAHRHRDDGREHEDRRRRRRGPRVEAPPRPAHVHGVRTLPVGVSGVEHRQGAQPEAAHHEPARPRDGEDARPDREASTPRTRRARRRSRASNRSSATSSREDVLWACVTCGACVYECPVDIEHVDMIMEMRRNQVMMESAFPREAQGMLNNVESSGNPWGIAGDARMQWAKGMEEKVPVIAAGQPIPDDVEYLFFVGCAGASDDRAIKTTRAVAELLQQGWREVRRPRPPGDVQRRSRAPHRQRVPLPGDGTGERREVQRDGREEDHHAVPALLQHVPQRVPGLRRPLRRRPPRAAARGAHR